MDVDVWWQHTITKTSIVSAKKTKAPPSHLVRAIQASRSRQRGEGKDAAANAAPINYDVGRHHQGSEMSERDNGEKVVELVPRGTISFSKSWQNNATTEMERACNSPKSDMEEMKIEKEKEALVHGIRALREIQRSDEESSYERRYKEKKIIV